MNSREFAEAIISGDEKQVADAFNLLLAAQCRTFRTQYVDALRRYETTQKEIKEAHAKNDRALAEYKRIKTAIGKHP